MAVPTMSRPRTQEELDKLIAKAPEMAELLMSVYLDMRDEYQEHGPFCDCHPCKQIRSAERILREAGAL